MTNDTKEVKKEDLTKALSEIDGSAKEDKEVFRVDTDTFLLSDVEFKLIEDHKEAFDLEMMEERYTDYLLKYDYIVGDIAYEKLRLRGFYEDRRKGVPIDMKISNLEDYLIEYCSFGCAYFVFERTEKKAEDPESYFKRSNKQGSNKRRSSRNKRVNNRGRKSQGNTSNQNKSPQNKNQNQNQKQSDNKKKPSTQTRNQNQTNQQNPNKKQQPKPRQNKQTNKKAKDFQVVKKQEPKVAPKSEPKKVVAEKKTQNNKKFKIRKKKTDD